MLPAGITKGSNQSLLKPSRIAMDGCIGIVPYQEKRCSQTRKPQYIMTDSVSSNMASDGRLFFCHGADREQNTKGLSAGLVHVAALWAASIVDSAGC